MAEKKSRDADNPRPGRRAYLITALCAAAVSALYVAVKGVYAMSTPGRVLGHLSNAFTVPGVLLMGMAGLIFVKRRGGFDGVSYSTRYMFNWLVPQFWLNKDERSGKLQNYREYCANRREREKGRRDVSRCCLLVGAVFAVLGLACYLAMNLLFPDTVL